MSKCCIGKGWAVCIHNPLSACEKSDFDQTAKSHSAPNLNPLVRQLGVAHHEQQNKEHRQKRLF
jgi:hypothetical protein